MTGSGLTDPPSSITGYVWRLAMNPLVLCAAILAALVLAGWYRKFRYRQFRRREEEAQAATQRARDSRLLAEMAVRTWTDGELAALRQERGDGRRPLCRGTCDVRSRA